MSLLSGAARGGGRAGSVLLPGAALAPAGRSAVRVSLPHLWSWSGGSGALCEFSAPSSTATQGSPGGAGGAGR